MEFVTAIVSKMLEYTVQPVFRHCGYLFHYERNVLKLSDELKDLGLHKDRIMVEVNAARQRGDEIHADVIDWLNRAESVIAQEDRAASLKDENREKARCSNGNFPDLVSRYRQSRQAIETANRVTEIKGRSFDTVSYRPALQNSIVNKGYKAFETRMLAFNDIMKALRDPDVRAVGMYGMGGVGKTTLAKEIARQGKEEEKLFDKVIMVTVSQAPDYEKVQREVAENLGLEFSNNETQNSTRANRLRQQLSQETKILIVLDDVWKKIDLFDVGIDFNDNQNGCKILVTSRILDLLNSMDIKEKFSIEALTESEAKKLFCEFVGDLGENPRFINLLTNLVKECGGVPLVIRTVARALKDKPLERWKTALNELRSSAPETINDMLKEVYPSLKMSYEFLESGEAKSLLLLCSMFPEDKLISAEDLLMYSVGWGFLKHIETLEMARDRMYTLIDILRDNCLLLPSDKSPFDKEYHWVKVHDVIRDVSISIASEKGWFNISSITQLEEWPPAANLKDSVAISLLCDFANKLPNRLAYPKLKSFFVPFFPRSFQFKPIPDCFFEETKELRVLNLPCVCLKSPPLSFTCLFESLQTLRLIGCDLEDTAFIGDLKNLKCLDLSWSKFKKLSKQIGDLTRLQLLALDYCTDLKVIEPSVISSLMHLEELYMRKVRMEWEAQSNNNNRRNVSLVELKGLRRLNTLCIQIEKIHVMPEKLFTKNLKTYEIIVGPVDRYAKSCSKFLDLELPESSLLYTFGLEKLIEQSEGLWLRGLKGVTDNVCELDKDAFPFCKDFKFENNGEVRYIVNSVKCNQPAFQNLEKMHIVKLTNLQAICHGELKENSFSKLKDVSVRNCDSLKNLFPFPIAIVRQLEKIEVIECKMMKEITVCKREDGIEFPKLLSLTLKGLPKLVQFWRYEGETSSSSALPNCSLPLFNEKVEFPNLEKLKLFTLDSVHMLWPNRLPKVSSVRNLKRLSVKGCDRLMYLFSFAMARSFVQLKELSVSACEMMEEVLIVTKEPGEDHEGRPKEITILFPQLEKLVLSNLLNLRRFCGGDLVIESPSLWNLRIENCPKLKTFINTYTEEVEASEEETLFSEKVAFPRLKKLEITGRKSLKFLLSYDTARSLTQLQSLEVVDCRIMEVVVVIKEPFRDGRLQHISFSKLEYVKLYFLPRLERFSSVHCIECPSLKWLYLNECHGLGTSTVGLTTDVPIIKDEREVEERELVATQPLVIEKVAFSNSLMVLRVLQTSFKNLVKLEISCCNNLEYLFQLHSVESFAHLKELKAWQCNIIEEVVVVTKEVREEGSLKKISFPTLKFLHLESLPRLKRFCVADCIECPSLLELYIRDCPELSTFIDNSAFTPTLATVEEEIGERDLVAQHPMFNEKVMFPNLEGLTLFRTGSEILNEIWPSQSSAVPFAKLKYLYLHCSEDRGVLRFDIHKYQNLESISLGGFSCVENFEQHRETLEVKSCGRLKTLLMSSSVTFKNLGELRISECHRTTEVFDSSTVKCLVQLKTMSISNCGRMMEIIVDKEVETQSTEIAFTQLETLCLHCLPTLKSFYCRNSSIQFPKLKKVIVSECPQMENFSGGTVITSKLNTVITKIGPLWDWQIPEYAECIEEVWEGDLNTSIRIALEDDLYNTMQRLFYETDDKDC